ncbi:LPXTG cell wall anchor domain-containing protein [Streptomyces microflavus]|uniref:LPXTG cell wall anchor domain-containing protein n=1 Tax=Streptomyces microflavus TaxID=1919 RepID=UPI0036EDC323
MTPTPGTPPTGPGRPRRPGRRLGAAAVAALLLAAVPAGAVVSADAATPKSATGPQGQKLTVSATTGLDPAGAKIRVTGEGYGTTSGIYVALCKDNGANRVPSPCLGGADMSGGSKNSQWIVPKGDPYEGELALPFGPGGTFDVEIEIRSEGDGLDCADVPCSVVTRADHRASGDRTQDVRIPVTFAGQEPGEPGGEGVDVPAGTVSYKPVADFTSAGKPLDLLLHPDAKKLYVGADNLPDTADVDERGLYVLNPEDGKAESRITDAPGSTGALRASAAARISGPLPGDGVVYNYPLRGVGSAKAGDAAATGVWLAGSTITDIAPGTAPGTVLVAQGAKLSEIERATGTATRSLTLPGGTQFAADHARGAVWFSDFAAGKLHRVDLASFAVTASFDLPGTDSIAGFTEVDPASGAVWVGVNRSVLVFDATGKPMKTLVGKDLARDAAFDAAGGRAFVAWQDGGDLSDPANDNNGTLTVYDSTDFTPAAKDLPLPGNQTQLGAASLAVEPGGATVFVTSPAEGKITRLTRQVSPLVTQAPADRSVRAGEEVALTARAEGTPDPSVRWQVSTDGSQTWRELDGATEPVLTFTAKSAQDGYRYRAEFRNGVGTTRTAPVTLTVTEATGGATGGDAGGGNGGSGDTTTGGAATGGDGSTGGDSNGDGSDGGTSTGASGSSGGSGSSAGSTGSTVGGGSVGGNTGTGTTSGGSLAATGITVIWVTLLAAALLGGGLLIHRRARRRTTGLA